MNQPGTPFDLSAFLPYRMTVAAEKLSAGMARRYRDEFGISVAEWRVLVHVADAGSVSIRDINSRVHLEKSKASRAASRLQAAGLLKKDTDAKDRRLVALTLTEDGRAMMDRLIVIAQDYQARLDALVGGHVAALEAALDALIAEDL